MVFIWLAFIKSNLAGKSMESPDEMMDVQLPRLSTARSCPLMLKTSTWLDY